MLTYRERRPLLALKPDVECLWWVTDRHPRPTRPTDRIVPDGCPELIVHLGDPFCRRVGNRWRKQPRIFLAGTLSRPWHLRAGPRVHTLGIRFRPGAVTSRLPFDMAPTTDREVPLSELIGRPDADDFETKLARAHRHGRALSFAERWLTNRPARARRRTDDVTRPIVRAILRTRGRRRIDELAADLGIHRRRLERAFARDLGVRPKLFARIVRLNAAIATLDRMDGSRAVDWALEAGYFDQAHLARDFRTVAGRSPRQPRGAGDEMARHFTASGRLSAYLAGE